MIHLIYADKQQEKEPFVSVNNLIKPKKVNFDEKSLEGNGGNLANDKEDPSKSTYEKFEAEVKRIGEEKQEKADVFWAMKGIVTPPLSKTNISYRDSLVQKVGGSDIAILQASLVVIGYDLGTYGPDANGVDGYMGPVTESVIKEFQKTAGLTPTGNVDDQTINALELVVEAGLKKEDLQQIKQALNEGFNYNWTGKNVTSEFKSKILEISNELRMDPDDLMAIIAFESGFSPSIRNKASGATGLIQFMGSTAKLLGTTTDDLAKMSAVEQLDYVYKYFKPYAGKIKNIEDAYMAVFMPIAVGKSNDFVLGIKDSTDKLSGISYGLIYKQNSGLDINKDGKITKEEAASCVINTRNRYNY